MFSIDGKLIPKGSSVGVTPYLMGYDPKIFKDPETFFPERFLVDSINQNPYAYVPFSAGSRNCKFLKLCFEAFAENFESFKLKILA